MKFNTEILNSELIEVFKKSGVSGYLRSPLFYPELETYSLLFIGSNPSFLENAIKERLIKEAHFADKTFTVEEVYDIKNIDKYQKVLFDFCVTNRMNMKGDPSGYFKKFSLLAENIGVDWDHIDIFYIRNTNQDDVKKLRDKYPDFFERQLSISVNLIKELKPLMIIVCNAWASSILKEKLRFPFNEEIGTYVYSVNGKDVPVFLSGMLSGQRALDVESFERLRWHAKWVFEKIYKP